MFDSSWLELGFVAVLALLIIGPKDMPKLFKVAGNIVRKTQRFYRELLGSVNQLEKEVALASADITQENSWRELMPEHLRNLPADFIPGSMSEDQHQQRTQQQQAFEQQTTPAIDSNDIKAP